jgi:hypothetical protein
MNRDWLHLQTWQTAAPLGISFWHRRQIIDQSRNGNRDEEAVDAAVIGKTSSSSTQLARWPEY